MCVFGPGRWRRCRAPLLCALGSLCHCRVLLLLLLLLLLLCVLGRWFGCGVTLPPPPALGGWLVVLLEGAAACRGSVLFASFCYLGSMLA